MPSPDGRCPKKRTYSNQELQDDIDAETIYNMLEFEIVPAYYSKDEDGIPREWTSYIKNTMVKVAPEFTTRRMLNDYMQKYYTKAVGKEQADNGRQLCPCTRTGWMEERYYESMG
ncbi:MAG: hypothetical protein MZV63_17850 [Marinilabiliales bacterium]|nr:hypothetical protein [Marinilabiliales bacterium]